MGEAQGGRSRARVLGRRDFLGAVALGSLPLATSTIRAAEPPGRPPRAGGDDPFAFPGLITREREPLNLEFPFPTLDGPITPADRFFVRGHFPIPKIDPEAWRLKVDGEVDRELELSLDDLKGLAQETVAATIECAGNGRASLVPKARGLLWEQGAVGNAEWSGVPLAAILAKAGVKAGAVEVILEGADRGEVADPQSPGPIAFERSIPLEKALRPEVLLAHRMNGEDLTPEHGSPVRAIVPGWYGMASIKWLGRISVTKTPFRGFWQTHEYAYFGREGGRPSLVPVGEMQVKSSIARPALREVVPPGATYKVTGAAWAGEAQVAKVELSTDGGATWREAKLLGESVPFSWRLWEAEWQAPDRPGRHRLMSRATDTRGHTQPTSHDRDRRNYMINYTVPVEVEVG